jgi:hypothetical protein
LFFSDQGLFKVGFFYKFAIDQFQANRNRRTNWELDGLRRTFDNISWNKVLIEECIRLSFWFLCFVFFYRPLSQARHLEPSSKSLFVHLPFLLLPLRLHGRRGVVSFSALSAQLWTAHTPAAHTRTFQAPPLDIQYLNKEMSFDRVRYGG